jgi:hypothetical protein
MSKLGDAQRRFTVMVAQLVFYTTSLPGYQLTFGDAYRDPRVPYGHENSLHRKRLAVDLNLFVNGEYITCTGVDAERHIEYFQKIGFFWEHIGGTWGGFFEDPDPNHFSLSFGGMS